MATSMKVGLAGLPVVGKGRVVARNTWRYQTADGVEHIRLHGTDVVDILPKGKVRLNSGGWKTVTTKDRIDSFSGYRIFSRKGVWMVSEPGKWDNAIPFFDGMVLPDAFKMPPGKRERLITSQDKLKARIKAVVTKVIQAGQPVPFPEMGDCFICMAERSELAKRVEREGYDYSRAPRELDSHHIAEHIREGYIHGSLILNAYLDSGRKPFAFQMDARYIESGREYDARNSATNMRRILRAYLQRRMGLTAR